MTDPRTITPLPVPDWSATLDQVSADMNGQPINVHKLMAHNPDLLHAWWNFRNHSVAGGTLGPRRAELVILRVSVHLNAWYEWGSHVDRALRIGIALDTILQVMERDLRQHWSDEDALILRAVDELMENHRIFTATRASLEASLGTDQIMDLVAICGMYVTLGFMIHTWGLELDPSVAGRIDGLTDPQSFARAADAFARAKA